MLHGDGRYSPALIDSPLTYLHSPHQVVYGYRSWWHHWAQEETPLSSDITIKVLSLLESQMTEFFRNECHSGFIMYKRSFLSAVNFENIASTMHVNGHFLFVAGRLKVSVQSIPIFKRYKKYIALGLVNRMGYVLNVLLQRPVWHFIAAVKISQSQIT